MDEVNKKKSGSIVVGICIFTMLILVVALFFVSITYKKNVENQKLEISSLEKDLEEKENKIKDLENKISKISNVLNVDSKIISNIKYIEIEVEDTESTQGLAHKEPIKITDSNVIAKIEKDINSGTEYEPRSTAWPDISPYITFYLEDGKTIRAFVVDSMGEPEEENGNYIAIFESDNETATKKIYKIEAKLEKYINDLYDQYE